MSLFENETFLTIISGVIVFILSQYFLEFVLKPLQEYKELKSKIAYNLVYYANIFHNPADLKKELCDEASRELRKNAAELKAFSIKKPWYIGPKSKSMQLTASYLIGLSNSVNLTELATEDLKDIIENEKNIKIGIGLKHNV